MGDEDWANWIFASYRSRSSDPEEKPEKRGQKISVGKSWIEPLPTPEVEGESYLNPLTLKKPKDAISLNVINLVQLNCISRNILYVC